MKDGWWVESLIKGSDGRQSSWRNFFLMDRRSPFFVNITGPHLLLSLSWCSSYLILLSISLHFQYFQSNQIKSNRTAINQHIHTHFSPPSPQQYISSWITQLISSNEHQSTKAKQSLIHSILFNQINQHNLDSALPPNNYCYHCLYHDNSTYPSLQHLTTRQRTTPHGLTTNHSQTHWWIPRQHDYQLQQCQYLARILYNIPPPLTIIENPPRCRMPYNIHPCLSLYMVSTPWCWMVVEMCGVNYPPIPHLECPLRLPTHHPTTIPRRPTITVKHPTHPIQ